ncbi:flagellar hook protein FlgE [Lacibacterium aquatile]|uniref:Flagellar hook protein FlgE n=1 Tax=Lacibacterium aquatile TaxID=1168082 RepID=A0ABW5DNK7_9PROT
MSVYGALYSAVSGLKAQSTSMGIISDNISNANTVGYKGNSAAFSTLVTAPPSRGSYSPGGVLATTVQNIDRQGLLQASASGTDLAITGRGFFATAAAIDADGRPPLGVERLYTRAGSFTIDKSGNLTNTAGGYLLGVPVDTGVDPATVALLPTAELRAINVGSITGSARGTSTISLGANLPATDLVSPTGAATVTGGVYEFTMDTDKQAAGVVEDTQAISITLQNGDVYTANILTRNTATGYEAVIANITATGTAPAYTGPAEVALGTFTPQDGIATNFDFSATVQFAGGVGSVQFAGSHEGVIVAGAGVPAATYVETTAPTVANNLVTGIRMSNSTGTAASNSTNARLDLSSTTGGLQAARSTSVLIYDTLGVAHNVELAFVKTSANNWDVFITKMTIAGKVGSDGLPVDSISGTSTNSFVNADGTLKTDTTALGSVAGTGLSARLGSLGFTTDGSFSNFTMDGDSILNPASATAGVPLNGLGSTGAANFNPDISFGIAGTKSGVTQNSDDFAVAFVNQDGIKFGYRTGVVIDEFGVVRAVFDNGQRLAVAKIPLVNFANMNALQARTGNVYAETDDSGSATTNFAYQGGVGSITPNAVEGSTVDLAEEFSDMIVTQRTYSANARTITTSDEMLAEVINLKR